MKSFPCPIQKHARLKPQSPAIITDNKIITYAKLDEQISETVSHLKSKGFDSQRRVAICEPNSTDIIVRLWALWRMKRVVCLLSPRLPTQQISKTIKKIHAKLLSSEKIKSEASNPTLTRPIHFLISQAATIMFTSGSSGEPKAAQHSLGNHYYSALGSNDHIKFSKHDRWLLSLPLYHVGGLSILFRAFIAGGSVAIPQNTIEKSISDLLPTHISLVPTQLYRLLKDNKALNHLKKMKAILIGGSGIPEGLLEDAIKFNLPIYISYGLTEMSSQVATSKRIKNEKLKIKIVVLKHRKIKINSSGEILVKGQTLFQGYLRGNKLIKPFDRSGWFATGDVGYVTKHQGLRISGRKDRMFISGGENIQPEEIEKCLLKIKSIEKAVVVPKTDLEFGARPVAFIQFKSKMTEEGIQNKLEKSLPRFKIPIKFLPWPSHASENPSIKLAYTDFIAIANKT